MTTNERVIFLNGKFVGKEEAVVSVWDHGYLYGDGIFEGIRVYDGNVFRLREHMVRLYESAKSILLPIPYPLEELEEYVLETVRQNGLPDAYIRLIVSRGPGGLGLDPFECKPNVVIIVDHIRVFPQELYEKGLSVVTVPTRRNRPDAINPKIKSLNYLNNILARIEATQAGATEALMLNPDGYVTEGTGDNVFIVRRGKLFTPPGYLGILEGITRQTIMELAVKMNIEVREEPFTLHDVYVADEVFLTGTAVELIPVVEVDGRTIGEGTPGPITRELITKFRDLVTREGKRAFFPKGAA
jgi:branched-chain amino acid aminotransferase